MTTTNDAAEAGTPNSQETHPTRGAGTVRKSPKGGKKTPQEETVALTFSVSKSMARQIRVVVAASEKSASEWLADQLGRTLKKEFARVVAEMAE